MNKPTKKFSAGSVSATVWTNPIKDSDGEYNTITLERHYKDLDGNWKSTTTLRTSDIPKASLVLNHKWSKK